MHPARLSACGNNPVSAPVAGPITLVDVLPVGRRFRTQRLTGSLWNGVRKRHFKTAYRKLAHEPLKPGGYRTSRLNARSIQEAGIKDTIISAAPTGTYEFG